MTPNDEITIDLLKILKACVKKVWLIILVAAILGGGMFAYGKATYMPAYTASTTLYASYVNARNFAFGENTGNISQSSLSESRSLVDTCTAVLNTRSTLEAVIDEAGVEMTSSKLATMITAAAVNKTELFDVTVTAGDPDLAALLANTIGKVLPSQVAMVNSNSNVGVIDEALVPAGPDANDILKNAAVATVLGAFVVCVVIAVQNIVEDFKTAKAKMQ